MGGGGREKWWNIDMKSVQCSAIASLTLWIISNENDQSVKQKFRFAYLSFFFCLILWFFLLHHLLLLLLLLLSFFFFHVVNFYINSHWVVVSFYGAGRKLLDGKVEREREREREREKLKIFRKQEGGEERKLERKWEKKKRDTTNSGEKRNRKLKIKREISRLGSKYYFNFSSRNTKIQKIGDEE